LVDFFYNLFYLTGLETVKGLALNIVEYQQQITKRMSVEPVLIAMVTEQLLELELTHFTVCIASNLTSCLCLLSVTL